MPEHVSHQQLFLIILNVQDGMTPEDAAAKVIGIDDPRYNMFLKSLMYWKTLRASV